MMTSSKNIALLGGSFDPPHLAHVQVVKYLLKTGRFDQIWIVPSPQNPLKGTPTSFSDRVAMCRLAFAGLGENVLVSEEEAQLSGFTIDLARQLHDKFPQHRFTFVGGSDLQQEMKRWKDPEALKSVLSFEFLPRPPDPTSPFASISSTEVRERIKKGLPMEDLVLKAVGDYIREHGLYI